MTNQLDILIKTIADLHGVDAVNAALKRVTATAETADKATDKAAAGLQKLDAAAPARVAAVLAATTAAVRLLQTELAALPGAPAPLSAHPGPGPLADQPMRRPGPAAPPPNPGLQTPDSAGARTPTSAQPETADSGLKTQQSVLPSPPPAANTVDFTLALRALELERQSRERNNALLEKLVTGLEHGHQSDARLDRRLTDLTHRLNNTPH